MFARILSVLVLCSFFSSTSFLRGESLEGRWRGDDGKATVELKLVDGSLHGYLVDWKNKKWTTDSLNPNRKLRSRPLKGICVLYGFSKEGKKWKGGRIYDASEGDIYRATLWPEGNDTVVIRAFIGVSLIGKTTRWHRL